MVFDQRSRAEWQSESDWDDDDSDGERPPKLQFEGCLELGAPGDAVHRAKHHGH